MTRAEQKAFDRGKHAAFRDAREPKRSGRARCEFRSAKQRRAWLAGYEAQQAQATAQARTPEQDANVAGLASAIEAWLARTKTERRMP